MKVIFTLVSLFLMEASMAVTIQFEERVRSIEERGEKYEITFFKKAAFYHILKGSAQEKSVLPLLQKQVKKDPVKLVVDPDTHEIMAIQDK